MNAILQNEMHYVSEKLTIAIEVLKQNEGFLIKYDNGRVDGENFRITLDYDLMFSLLKEFENRSNEFITKEELHIESVVFDFFRNNSLYFDVFFQNKDTQKSFHARLYVYYKCNNHGNIGEIHEFHLVSNEQ